jgi:hypothetical protein
MQSRNRSSTNKRQRDSRQSIVHALRSEATKMDTLVDLQRTQIHGSIPVVRDIPRLHLKRQKVYTFSRGFPSSTVSAPTAVDTLAALNFTLGALPASTDFTSLFDQYRIIQVTVRFIPLAGAGTGSNPLVTAIDYDDSTAPTAVTDLFQYDSVIFSQPGTTVERTLKPRVATAAYSGAFTSFASADPNLWIDVASPNVQYYGLKYGIAAATGATANWSLLIEYVLQCRNTR